MVFRTTEALHALSVGAAAGIDIFGNRCGADKAHGFDIGIIKNGIDGLFVAIHHIENSRRQAGFHEQFGNAQGHTGITLGRFQNEGIASRNGGRAFPQGDHGRKIEGGNACHHAQRLAHGINIDIRSCAVGEFAFEHLRGANAEFDHFQTALNVAFRIGYGFAVLLGQQHGQLVIFFMHQLEKFHQDAGAALRIGGGPAWLCGFGIFHSGAHFGRIRQRDFGGNFTGHRPIGIRETARCSLDMFSADKMRQFRNHIVLHGQL